MRLTHGVAAFLACCLTSGLTPAAERLVVGLYLNGREGATVEVLRDDDGFLVPLEALAEAAACRVETIEGRSRLRTPLGLIDLPAGEMLAVDGVVYLRERFIRTGLATRIDFDAREFALRLDPPWHRAGSAAAETRAPRTAELAPPGLSLSTLHQDLHYGRYGELDSARSSTLLAGSLEGGFWRVRYDDDLEADRRLRDYAWYRTSGRRMFLAGQQTIQLHPLMRTFELTGVQAAWTNQPLEIFPSSGEARELLPRRVQPAATFRGQAAPGSLAKLRVDGVVTEQQIVGMSGRYEFLEVRLPARQLTEVEVLIFDRHRPSAPAVIHEHRLSASEFLLPRGATVHMGGAGRQGNLANDALDTDEREGAAGFYQWRHGLSERLTLEGGVQSVTDLQLQAGFTARAARNVIVSLGVGGSNGEAGYNLDLDGHGRRWRLLASSRRTPAGYYAEAPAELFDHAVETWLRGTDRFELGLIGRKRTVSGDSESFVLPAMFWRPFDRLSLRARPDIDGDYRVRASCAATDRDRILVTHEDDTVVDYVRRLNAGYRLTAAFAFGGERKNRQSLILSRRPGHLLDATWSAGLLSTEDRKGFVLGATVPMPGGLLGRLSYESIPYSGVIGSGRDDRLELGLTLDLTLAGRRLQPARSTHARPDRGAVAGRILPGDDDLPSRFDLRAVDIVVDGQLATRTDARGRFHVGNLKPGVYRVELGVERLPVELVPERTSFTARVVAGASTRVDFDVHVEYGVAGRVVLAEGLRLEGLRVELVDSAGRVTGQGRIDRFGLYRIDGVRAGSYRLRLVGRGPLAGAGLRLPTRQVEIADRFLFDQDLEVEVLEREP